MRFAAALATFLLAVAAANTLTGAADVKPDPRVRRLRLRPRDRLNKLRARGTSSAAPAVSAPDHEEAELDESSSSRSTRQLPAALRTRKRVRRPTTVATPAAAAEEASGPAAAPSRGGFGFSRPDDDDDDEDFTLTASKPEESAAPFVPSRGGAPPSRGGAASRLSSSSSSSSALPRRNSLSAPKLTSPSKDGYKVVCYYTNWSQYRPKIGKFQPEDINPKLCTHVIFAFGWIKKGKLSSFEAGDISADGKSGLYQRVVGLKAKNPDLKVLLAIGGWSFGTAKFRKMAETRFSRQTFIFSAIPFLRKHNFDGLDMDWEYPKSNDKDNFVLTLKELREAFEYEAEESGNERLLLTAAVPVGPDNVRGGYNVPEVAKWLDFINLMAYDFHGKWEKQAGHNAPLYAPSSDSEWRKQLSVSFAAKMWMRLGTPKEKLVIGMPTYGRSFTLTDKRNYIVNSAAKDGGKAGDFTREAGFLSYYEVCQMLLDGASYIWDDEMKVPYLVKGDQWVGFDDERSIRHKMDWIKASSTQTIGCRKLQYCMDP